MLVGSCLLRRQRQKRRAKRAGLPCGSPAHQAYFWVPSIPSVAWQPYPSPLGRLRAHSFASPPHDGFAFIEDAAGHRISFQRLLTGRHSLNTTTIGQLFADASDREEKKIKKAAC